MLLCVLAFGLRAYRIEHAALDHDEVYEVARRTTDLGELASRADRFPPLYRWLVSLAIEATGYDMAVRWFSAVVGALTIVPVGLLAKEIAGRRAGLAAAALLAISGHHLMISQQARGYALMVLCCSWMLYAGWRLRTSDRLLDWALFLTSAWLAIATHYFAGIALLLLGGMLLVERHGVARRNAIVAAVLLAVAGVPLMVCLQADLSEGDQFYKHPVVFDKENYAYSYMWLVSGGTLGPTLTELREYVDQGKTREGILAMLPWALGVMGCVGVLSLSAWRRIRAADRAWFAILLLAPPWLLLALTPVTPTGYNFRYLVWLVAPMTVWLAIGATLSRRRPLTTLATLALVALAATAAYNRHHVDRYNDDDYHGVVALIQQEHAGDAPPAVLIASRYYARGVVYTLPDWWIAAPVGVRPDKPNHWNRTLPAFADRLTAQDDFWFVTSWKPASNAIRRTTDELIARLGADFVARVGDNVLVYRGSAASLRAAAAWAVD